jgi:BMFP domain-containing protein YqiC
LRRWREAYWSSDDASDIRLESGAAAVYELANLRPSTPSGAPRPESAAWDPLRALLNCGTLLTVPRTLSPEDVSALRDAVVAAIDSRIDLLDKSLGRQFAAVNERLDLVEQRIARLEERVAGLIQGHTRARTSDIDRIAALEARVAELEAKLAARE